MVVIGKKGVVRCEPIKVNLADAKFYVDYELTK